MSKRKRQKDYIAVRQNNDLLPFPGRNDVNLNKIIAQNHLTSGSSRIQSINSSNGSKQMVAKIENTSFINNAPIRTDGSLPSAKANTSSSLKPSLFKENQPFSSQPKITKVDYHLSKDRSIVKTVSGKIEKLGTFQERREQILKNSASSKTMLGNQPVSHQQLMNLCQDFKNIEDCSNNSQHIALYLVSR